MIWGIIVIVAFIVYDIIPTYIYKFKYIICRKKSGNNIYLTFDDGPSEYTLELLDLLRKYNIKCSFFVVGEFAMEHKNIIDKMKEDGHLIGVHSYKHENAWFMGYKRIKEDFYNSICALKNMGIDVKYYRAPWGNINLFSLLNVKKFKLDMVFWNVMVEDWRSNTTSSIIKNKIIKRVSGGDIICLHDGRGKMEAPLRTIKALEKCIPILLEKGYKFRRIDSYDEK